MRQENLDMGGDYRTCRVGAKDLTLRVGRTDAEGAEGLTRTALRVD
jgi:hypothetical protein